MPSLQSIFLGIIVALVLALVLALGGTAWALRSAWKGEAAAEQARDIAIAANKTNLETIDRLEGDVVIAQATAIADAQAHAKAETERDELVAAANAAKNDGDCAALDAVLERRRLQRQ